MQKIAKTKFKRLLIDNNNVLIGAFNNQSKEQFDMLIEKIESLDKIEYLDENVRRCIKVNSNSLEFSNNSMLYFDKPSKCYTFNNGLVIMVDKTYDRYDEEDKYHTVIYLIV